MSRPHIKLKKKRSTEDQIINEIHSLLHGTGTRPYPLTVTETAKVLGVSRDTIYRYVKKMKGESRILKTQDRLVLPKLPEDSKFRQFNKLHPITGDPLVTEWIDDLLTRKGGSPLKNWSRRICCLETVCNTCKILPQDLIVSHRKTEKIMRTFARFYTSGNSIQSKNGVGIESCARFDALYNMSLEYTKSVSQKSGKTTYIMTAIETKTEHIHGGKWSKYISKKDTQTSLDLLKNREGKRIHENNIPKYKFTENISTDLKQIYKHLGKQAYYFQHHPTHALRHIGAHYWLSKTDYNYGLIAEIGGWNNMDELKKSYGQIPPERILEIID